MNRNQRRAKSAEINAEMRRLHGELERQDDAEKRAKFDALAGELAPLNAAEERDRLFDDLDRRAGGGEPVDDGDRKFAELRASVGLLDTIRAQMPGVTDAGAGRARELSQELGRRSGRTPKGLLFDMRSASPDVERRVTTTGAQGTANVGGALVPTINRPDLFIDRLRNSLVVRALGARVVSDLTGNVSIPRRNASVTAAWVAENQAIPPTDAAFGSVPLTPKTCGALSELSRNQIMQSSPDIEALTRDDMTKVLAEALDQGALVGDGTNFRPLGVVPQATTMLTYAKANAAPAWSDILGMTAALDALNVVPNAFVEGPGMRSLLMGTPKSTSLALGYVQDDPNNLAGLPARPSNLLPAGTLVLGDWTDVIIGFWSELDILVNPYADSVFAKGNVQIRAMMTCDVAVRHSASFAVLTHAAS